MVDLKTMDHAYFMRQALTEARRARDRGDRAIGCVVVRDGLVISRGSNWVNTDRSEFEHAELAALRSIAQTLFDSAKGCVLYTTLEPCVMCLGTIVLAGIRHVVYGAPDPVHGASEMYRKIDYVRRAIDDYFGGVLEEECIALRARS